MIPLSMAPPDGFLAGRRSPHMPGQRVDVADAGELAHLGSSAQVTTP
jgi:hypothetical protein